MRSIIRRLALTGMLVLVAALGAGGCGDDFAPYNRLTTFRVLAIASDPPAPGPDETTTLSALLFTLPDDPVMTYKWDWCPFPGPANEGYPCPTKEEVEAQAVALGVPGPISIPDFELGDGETATFTNTVPVDFLTLLCAGDSNPERPLLCNGGFPTQIILTVTTANGDTIKAVRDLRLRPDLTEPNLNPKLDGIVAVLGDVEVPITDDPATTVTIPRDPETVIRVGLAPEVAELYNGRNDDRVFVGMRERLTLSWFVETGDVKYDKTAFIENAMGMVVEPFGDARENKWHPARLKDYPGDTATIVVVIRDNRGAFGWVRGLVRLEAPP